MNARICFLLALAVSLGAGVAAAPPQEAERVVLDALAGVESIPEQARVLARLAWPDPETNVGPEVSAYARAMLVGYDSKGMQAMAESLRRCGPARSADIVAALVEAMKGVSAGIPVHFLPALEEALWIGSPDAQRIAMAEVARFGYDRAVLPIMDAAVEHPSLVPDAIDALATMRNDRARFWLGEIVESGSDDDSAAAAAALARIGGPALATLQDLCLSEDPRVRRRAVLALAQVAGPDEVTTLHEYLYSFPDDDPQTLGIVRASAIRIEKWIDQFHAGQGTEPEPDF